MTTLTFCLLETGRLPQGIKETLARIFPALAGKKIRLIIEEDGETSSDKQRRYCRGVIVPAFMDYFAKQGKHFDNDTMHDQMMRVIGGFSNPYVNAFTGEPDEGRLSYNKLTKAQTEGYHTLCRKWAAEKNFDIPEPNEDLTYGYQ